MPISETDVAYAYRMILGREPESEHVIQQYTASSSIDEIREGFLNSTEFINILKARGYTKVARSHISHDDLQHPKIVFIHIPKTAGTTLHEILVKQFPPEQVCPERFNGLAGYACADLARWRLFSGHFDFTNAQLIPGQKLFVTVLRDPVKRLNSLYYFQRAHHPEIAQQDSLHLAKLASRLSPAEFFALDEVRAHPSINNAMTQVLSGMWPMYRWEHAYPDYAERRDLDMAALLKKAITNMDSLSAIGTTERFDDSLEYIMTSIGMETPALYESKMVLDKISTEDPGLHTVERREFSPYELELIQPLIEYDIQLYNIATARLNAFVAKNNAERLIHSRSNANP